MYCGGRPKSGKGSGTLVPRFTPWLPDILIHFTALCLSSSCRIDFIDSLVPRLTTCLPAFTLCHTGVAGAQATEQAGELAMANMEAKAQRGAEEELKRRQESKLNDYQGYVADVWGADTAKPDELDAKKVRGGLTGDRGALG